MNLMLAVVYDAFTNIEQGKFKKLFLHKRKVSVRVCVHLWERKREKDMKE